MKNETTMSTEQALEAKYRQDLATTVQRRDTFAKELVKLDVRINQLEGAIFALGELKAGNVTPEVTPILKAQEKRDRKAAKNVTPSASTSEDSAPKAE